MQCVYKRNIEAFSCNNCCSGKAVSCVCVCVLAVVVQHTKAHAQCYIVICGLSFISCTYQQNAQLTQVQSTGTVLLHYLICFSFYRRYRLMFLKCYVIPRDK